MNIKNWLAKNTASLKDKTVAISGSTGGIGRELCLYLAELGASLILLDRNPEKVSLLTKTVKKYFPKTDVSFIKTDLEDIENVKSTAEILKMQIPDVLILNAGAYAIPRHKCSTGLDNVFQINFASPYYLVRKLFPSLTAHGSKVVAVGSIAHNYSKTDLLDTNFSTRTRASLAYGNAKRFLMFSLFGLCKNTDILSVTHPGITFTNITAHYPKPIFALIKHPMKVIFMKPRYATLSILRGVFDSCDTNEWIGPAIFNIWGSPKKQRLNTCSEAEAKRIFEVAEDIYNKLSE